jgi:hypothetical protein
MNHIVLGCYQLVDAAGKASSGVSSAIRILEQLGERGARRRGVAFTVEMGLKPFNVVLYYLEKDILIG